MSILSYLEFFPNSADARTKDWFLVNSVWPIIIIIYLYVKLVKQWGPKWMENRPPFQIDRIVQLFDVSQVLMNGYVFYMGFRYAWLKYDWQCEPIDTSMSPHAFMVAELIWDYFIIKIIDLLDTVIFVLRKKQNQITFLHVYHHASMVLIGWIGVRFLPGGHGSFFGLLNTFIHTIMYTHYFIMSLKICEPWWKIHLTQLQLFQFFLNLYHFAQLFWVKDCGYPKWVALLFIPQNLMMIWMFGNFYYRTYVKAPKQTKLVNGSSKTNHAKNVKRA